MASRKINCPRCGQETVYGPENPFRPFCSERCRLIDLGQWASEKYRVESPDSGSVQDLTEDPTDDPRRESEEENEKN